MLSRTWASPLHRTAMQEYDAARASTCSQSASSIGQRTTEGLSKNGAVAGQGQAAATLSASTRVAKASSSPCSAGGMSSLLVGQRRASAKQHSRCRQKALTLRPMPLLVLCSLPPIILWPPPLSPKCAKQKAPQITDAVSAWPGGLVALMPCCLALSAFCLVALWPCGLEALRPLCCQVTCTCKLQGRCFGRSSSLERGVHLLSKFKISSFSSRFCLCLSYHRLRVEGVREYLSIVQPAALPPLVFVWSSLCVACASSETDSLEFQFYSIPPVVSLDMSMKL